MGQRIRSLVLNSTLFTISFLEDDSFDSSRYSSKSRISRTDVLSLRRELLITSGNDKDVHETSKISIGDYVRNECHECQEMSRNVTNDGLNISGCL